MMSASLLVQCLVGLGFIARAARAFLGHGFTATAGRPLRRALGALQLLGGVALLAALAQPFLVFFVSVFLALLVLVQFALPAVRGVRDGRLVLGALLAGSVAAGALQPLGLKVIALPRADELPTDLVVASRVVKTYDEGLWFESVKAGPDGTLYLAGNQGEDYATGDKRDAHAQVIARAPDGAERVLFHLPEGSTAGVLAFDADGQLVMTGQGANLGVWRLTPDGRGTLFARFPEGAWPNGLAAGPDGQLYVADAALGAIWRVDPRTGAIARAVEGEPLRARRFIALAPGANGLHFHGRDLFVTVSDAGRVLRYTLEADGTLAPRGLVAEGIPGDDFAIDDDGTLYITTHPFNTIVRVDPAGRRTVVATATQGIVGATDAAFGTTPADRDTLYVATDGGAFSGDAKARGTLVALRVRR